MSDYNNPNRGTKTFKTKSRRNRSKSIIVFASLLVSGTALFFVVINLMNSTDENNVQDTFKYNYTKPYVSSTTETDF